MLIICVIIYIFYSPNAFTDDESDMENAFKRGMPWLDDFGMKDASNSILPGLSLVQWMSMQQNQRFPGAQPASFSPVVSSTALQSSLGSDDRSGIINIEFILIYKYSKMIIKF